MRSNDAWRRRDDRTAGQQMAHVILGRRCRCIRWQWDECLGVARLRHAMVQALPCRPTSATHGRQPVHRLERKLRTFSETVAHILRKLSFGDPGRVMSFA
mmetsp:Transcript_81025/g.234964  ORF Transcript_81025/g.234964 Transcript_81025/m.234964 type:complete len:100 (+) Transcript_81025:1207-1506(+)